MKIFTRVLTLLTTILLISLVMSFKVSTYKPDIESLYVDNPFYDSHLKYEVTKKEEVIPSSKEIKSVKEEIKTEVKDKAQKVINSEEKEEPKEVELSQNNNADKIDENIIEMLTGTMSGYGPDCYGCTTNRTASGYYVGEGNIYYNDASYGNIRIVAADKKYPFGTIVKIKGLDNPIYAIVLDRGGNIGVEKKYQFDLLFVNEASAEAHGVKYNLTFEILRLGY